MIESDNHPPQSPTATLARPGLFAGLVRAQRAAEAVAKNGRNNFHHYAYASAEDVIQAGRDALAEGGLALFCTTHEVFVMLASRAAGALGAEDPGEEETVAVRVRYLLAHESGESQAIVSETPVIPEKGRPWDKALAAAKTFDLSYTLRGVLLLPRGDQEGGVDDRNDRDTSRNGRGGGRGRNDRGPPAEDRRPPQSRTREPERPAEATAKTPPPPTFVRDEAFATWWAGMQEAGYTADATKALAARMFSVDSPRKLTPDQRAAVLTEAKRAGAPERDMSGARPVLDEARDVAREAAEAAAEQQDARRQQQRATRGGR